MEKWMVGLLGPNPFQTSSSGAVAVTDKVAGKGTNVTVMHLHYKMQCMPHWHSCFSAGKSDRTGPSVSSNFTGIWQGASLSSIKNACQYCVQQAVCNGESFWFCRKETSLLAAGAEVGEMLSWLKTGYFLQGWQLFQTWGKLVWVPLGSKMSLGIWQNVHVQLLFL